MTRPILSYIGSKHRVADKIVSVLPPHTKYIEPFGGGLSIFFAKPLAKKNVLSDINKSVSSFHKQVKNNGCKVLNSCVAAKHLTHKSARDAVKKTQSEDASACETFVAAKTARNSNFSYVSLSQRYFDEKFGRNAKLNIPENCEEARAKLKHASILNEDYKTVMKKHDGKNSFFYLDPPYGKLRLYKHDSVTAKDVCDAAKNLTGKVLISYSDTPEVRKACRGMHFNKIGFKYTNRNTVVGPKNNKGKVNELLISNYKLPVKLNK